MIIKISFVINLIQRRTLLCFANFVRLRSGCCWTFFFTKGSSDHAWRQAHYLSSHHSATTSRGALVKKENKSIKSFAILELPLPELSSGKHTEYERSNEANGRGLRREGTGGETFAFPLVPSVLSAHSLSSFLSWQIALSTNWRFLKSAHFGSPILHVF